MAAKSPGSSRQDRAQRRVAERARQRADRRQRERAAERRTLRRKRAFMALRRLVVTAAAVVLVGAGIVFVLDALRPSPRTLPPTTPAASYRVVYRVEFQPGNVVRQEEHIVERPFNSILRSSLNGKMDIGQLTNQDGLYFFDATRGWYQINPGTQRSANDPQPALALQQAIRLHLAKVTGSDTVLGRPCTAVQTGNSLGQPIKAATAATHVELCLDRSGVILRYSYTLNGALAERMDATAFELNPQIAADTFHPTPLSNQNQLVQSHPLDDAGRAKLSPKFNPPAGVTYLNGISRIQPLAGSVEVSTSEMFRVGSSDAVELDYGQGTQTHVGRVVDLGGGHVGYLNLQLDASILTITPNTNSTLTMTGTDPDLLVSLAKRFVYP